MYNAKHKLALFLLTVLTLAATIIGTQAAVYAAPSSGAFIPIKSGNFCGKGPGQQETAINFGCMGDKAAADKVNPIIDLTFSILRFLSAGVGIVIVASVVVGGIQYTVAQGEPQKQAAARGRVINALIALLLFLFTFAIVQWLVPKGGLY